MSIILRTASAGDLAALDGSYVRLPIRGAGAWTIECASQVVPAEGEPVTLLVYPETGGAPDAFVGTVLRRKLVPGQERLVITSIAGGGHLEDDLAAEDYLGTLAPLPAGLVLASIVADAGELLADGVEDALDAITLPRWHRAGGTTARDAIDLFVADLTEATGLEIGWRVLPSGRIWAGVELWPRGGSADYIDEDPDDGVVIYAPAGAPLLPGTTIAGAQAVEVLYTLAPPRWRAHVRRAVPGDPPFAPRRRELYRVAYPAAVQAQRDDGTLDVLCDDARMGGLRAVPLRVGIPGAKVTVPAGARVRIGFENASPRAPFALALDQDPAAAAPVALGGGPADCGRLAFDPTAKVLYLSPNATAAYAPVATTAGPPPHDFPGTAINIAAVSQGVKLR